MKRTFSNVCFCRIDGLSSAQYKTPIIQRKLALIKPGCDLEETRQFESRYTEVSEERTRFLFLYVGVLYSELESEIQCRTPLL